MRRDWLQILTNLAVLIGLGLLIYELNLTRDLTRAQVIDSSYDTNISLYMALTGESPEDALAKAMYHPDELTESEAIVLTQLYSALLVGWVRLVDEAGIAFFGAEGYEPVIRFESMHLTSRPGRRWWAEVRVHTDPRIVSVVDEVLGTTDDSRFKEIIDKMLVADFEGEENE